jgi:hypothetical protein
MRSIIEMLQVSKLNRLQSGSAGSVFQHLLYHHAYLFLMLDGVSDCRFVVVEQRDVSRFLNTTAEDKSRYVPTDLNDRLERPAHTALPSQKHPGTIYFAPMRFLWMGGHWRIPI